MQSWFSDTIAPRSLRRRNLGEIERCQHRGDADRQPHEKAAEQQDDDALGDGGDEGAGDEQQAGAQDDAAAPGAVREVSGHRRTDRGTRQRNRDDDPLQCRREGHHLPNEKERAGDDAGVVAEQQAAQSGHGGDKIEVHGIYSARIANAQP